MVKRRPAAFSGGFPYRDGARRASLPRANARLLHIAAPGVAPDNPKNAEPFVDGVVFDNHLLKANRAKSMSSQSNTSMVAYRAGTPKSASVRRVTCTLDRV